MDRRGVEGEERRELIKKDIQKVQGFFTPPLPLPKELKVSGRAGSFSPAVKENAWRVRVL
jgi:hypothetical protein